MTIYQWVSYEFAPAFSRMLLHSLWIGVIASLLAVIIIVSTKKTPASTRYNWLVLLFVVVVAVTVTIFFKEFKTTELSNRGMASTAVDVNKNAVIFTVPPTAFAFAKKNVLSEVILFLDSNSLLIVCFWFLIFFFHLVKMGLGLRYVHILKRHRVHQADKQWITWLQQKSAELGIKKVILFLESELVKIPTAVGHLKPVILIPLGLLSQLSPQEVESILVHELAHIKRRDYLVNLLQNFVEAIFFFNPALLWISSLIKQEREKCCDDIAVQHSSRKDYLNALLSFQNIQPTSNYAMALGSRKHSLLDRVKRIISNENNRPGRGEVCLLLIAIIVTAFSFTALSKKVIKKKLLHQNEQSIKEDPGASPAIAEEKKYDFTRKSFPGELKNKISSIQAISERVFKSKVSITSTISFDQMDKEPVAIQNKEKPDTCSLPLREYHDISFKPISGKGYGYQMVEATDVNGNHYQIEALRQNIEKLIINAQEVSSESYEYYRDLVRHVEFSSQWKLDQKKYPEEYKEKILRAAQIAFDGGDRIRKITKQFRDTASNPGNTDSIMERVGEIQEEMRRKVSEIAEGKN